jgi:hypothetical protein
MPGGWHPRCFVVECGSFDFVLSCDCTKKNPVARAGCTPTGECTPLAGVNIELSLQKLRAFDSVLWLQMVPRCEWKTKKGGPWTARMRVGCLLPTYWWARYYLGEVFSPIGRCDQNENNGCDTAAGDRG